MDKASLLQGVSTLRRNAQGSRWSRLTVGGVRYLFAMLVLYIVYPITRRGFLRKTELFFGAPFWTMLPAATDIYLLGGKGHDSEVRLTTFLIHQLSNGQTMLDIGAHFGYFSLLASEIVGDSGSVHSFEPSRRNVTLLRKNTAERKNIVINHTGVSDREGEATLHEMAVLASEYASLIDNKDHAVYREKGHSSYSVPVTTVDQYVTAQNVVVDLIKIDVEGHEHAVISGMIALLQKHSPVVIMEYLTDGEGYLQTADLLRLYGYRTYTIDTDGRLQQVGDIPASLRNRALHSDNIVFKKEASA